jgi:hypothetical protein
MGYDGSPVVLDRHVPRVKVSARERHDMAILTHRAREGLPVNRRRHIGIDMILEARAPGRIDACGVAAV